MPQLVEPTAPDAQREIIRQSLDEIAAEVGTALRDAHLDFPVFLTVPNSGESLATMACPLDPSDERLVTRIRHRLSHHRATTGRRSTARTGITLRRRECDDRCYRCDGRHGERGTGAWRLAVPAECGLALAALPDTRKLSPLGQICPVSRCICLSSRTIWSVAVGIFGRWAIS